MQLQALLMMMALMRLGKKGMSNLFTAMMKGDFATPFPPAAIPATIRYGQLLPHVSRIDGRLTHRRIVVRHKHPDSKYRKHKQEEESVHNPSHCFRNITSRVDNFVRTIGNKLRSTNGKSSRIENAPDCAKSPKVSCCILLVECSRIIPVPETYPIVMWITT